MKTPEKVKKGLECCAEWYRLCGTRCPYFKDGCLNALTVDALALFSQMEVELAQVKRERDAAIEDVAYSAECWTCGLYGLQGDNCQKCRNHTAHPNWKWRGVQEVADE